MGRKGVPKRDGSGRGRRLNRARGGCLPVRDRGRLRKGETFSSPRRLQTVRFAGKEWFIDTRLEEYRNVKDPADMISFREAWKKY